MNNTLTAARARNISLGKDKYYNDLEKAKEKGYRRQERQIVDSILDTILTGIEEAANGLCKQRWYKVQEMGHNSHKRMANIKTRLKRLGYTWTSKKRATRHKTDTNQSFIAIITW